MNKTYHFSYIQIIFVVYFIYSDFCKVYAKNINEQENKFNTLIKELHDMYKDAFENERTYLTRRLFSNNGHTHYTLNVQKLKEVNGLKTHNLRLIGRTRKERPIIYINNPVEARLPNAFLSLDEFKNALLVENAKQRKDFDVNRNFLHNVIKKSDTFKRTPPPIWKTIAQSTTELPIKITKELFDNFANEIYHEGSKKMKEENKVSNTTELKTKKETNDLLSTSKVLKEGHHKINRKRIRKFHTSRATKSTTAATKEISHGTVVNKDITTESISDGEITAVNTVDDGITTETAVNEEITTETTSNKEKPTVVEEITTKATADEEITTETTADKERATVNEEITTETAVGEGNATETTAYEEETTVNKDISTETTADEEIVTDTIADEGNVTEMTLHEQETKADEEITTETTADKKGATVNEEITTETAVGEGNATEKIAYEEETTVNKDISTETTADEETTTETSSTETTTSTTENTTFKTTRTKQARPYVFLGGDS